MSNFVTVNYDDKGLHQSQLNHQSHVFVVVVAFQIILSQLEYFHVKKITFGCANESDSQFNLSTCQHYKTLQEKWYRFMGENKRRRQQKNCLVLKIYEIYARYIQINFAAWGQINGNFLFVLCALCSQHQL